VDFRGKKTDTLSYYFLTHSKDRESIVVFSIFISFMITKDISEKRKVKKNLIKNLKIEII
jgi:hypothetical protein